MREGGIFSPVVEGGTSTGGDAPPEVDIRSTRGEGITPAVEDDSAAGGLANRSLRFVVCE